VSAAELFDAARTTHRMLSESKARGIFMAGHIEIGEDAWIGALVDWPGRSMFDGFLPTPSELYGLPIRILGGNIPADGWRIVVAMGVIR
jgi:hypothetical protein